VPDRVVPLLLAGAVALLFASAAWHKLREPAGFRAILEGYRLLPAAALPAVGVAVPLIELLVAAALLVDGTRRIAALAGAALLLGYALAIGINLRRGRRDVSCGCGRDGGQPIAGWMLVRNGVLALVALLAALPTQPRPLQWVDALTLAAGVAAMALVYLCVEQLLATAARAATTGHAR
jgi:uncharacterized membrane protein YphA (DoxX/SURF4 family)